MGERFLVSCAPLTIRGQPIIISAALCYGEVAQLGERRVRNAKVVGSNPIFSTKFEPKREFKLLHLA